MKKQRSPRKAICVSMATELLNKIDANYSDRSKFLARAAELLLKKDSRK